MGISNGYTYNLGTIWNTRCNDNSIRIFHMETKQVHTANSNAGNGPRLQEIGRYYYQADRPTKVSANGTKKTKRDI